MKGARFGGHKENACIKWHIEIQEEVEKVPAKAKILKGKSKLK